MRQEGRLSDFLKTQVNENGELHLLSGTVNLVLKYLAMTEEEVMALRNVLNMNKYTDDGRSSEPRKP